MGAKNRIMSIACTERALNLSSEMEKEGRETRVIQPYEAITTHNFSFESCRREHVLGKRDGGHCHCSIESLAYIYNSKKGSAEMCTICSFSTLLQSGG